MPQPSGERAGLANIGRIAAPSCAGRACSSKPQWDPTVPHGNDRAFWCQHTYNCLGPDGKLVDDYECNPARKCYEAL